MQKVLMMFLMIGCLLVACDDAAGKKTVDNEAVGDTDVIASACGDGAVGGDEACEPGDTADCAEVTTGSTGTATCWEDCSGWDTATCKDTDECAATKDLCGDPDYAECENTDAGYRCICTNGYIPTSDELLCVPRYDFDGPIYHGDMLLVVNEEPNGEMSSIVGTLPQPGKMTKAALPRTPQAAVSGLPRRPFTAVERPLNRYRAIEPALDPVVGDRTMLWTSDLNTGKREQVEAEAVYVGEHCIMWSEVSGGVIAESTARGIADEFDNTIFDLVTENFYEPSDVDQNGKISMFFVSMGGNAGGYFSPYELYDYEDSNKADMIFIEKMIGQFGAQYASDVIAHEFEHLVHNNRDALVEGKQNFLTWMAEGMSTSAEHVYRGFQRDYRNAYNDSDSVSEGLSVTYWDYNGSDITANYALTYLFHQYIRIHSGQGNAFYRELIESPNNDHLDFDAYIQKYIDPELDCGKMLTNFRIALIMNEATGLYGFKKEPSFTNFSKKYWQGNGGNEFYLRGGGALQIAIDRPFKEKNDKEPGIRYIGIHLGDTAIDAAADYAGE
ncbi:MAG TPA: hypothetical protein PLV42_04925 [bacterium]|nr:hypothetical protein [bacterium]